MDDRMHVSDYFDGVYSQHDRYWWRDSGRYVLDPDKYPCSLLTQQTLRLLGRRPAIGRALDLGAGEGSDAIRLALLGYEVDAVEVSAIGAKKIQAFAQEARVKVRVFATDILDFTPDGLYVSLWSTYTPVPECHEIAPVYCDDEEGVVTASYRSWVTEFIYFERNKAETSHSDLPAHQHSHLKLIAAKPGA